MNVVYMVFYPERTDISKHPDYADYVIIFRENSGKQHETESDAMREILESEHGNYIINKVIKN